jgi:hypothetical protein
MDKRNDDKAVLEYLSQKILDDLRADAKISNEVLSIILIGDYIKHLRTKIKPKDKEFVIHLLKNRNILIQRLAISLSKAIDNDATVYSQLEKLWNQSNDFSIRFELMYRLLDAKNINEELVKDIHVFVTKNYNKWKKHVLKWGGGLEKVFKSIMAKIDDYPEHKRWVYLYELSWALENQEKARLTPKEAAVALRTIKAYMKSDVSMTRFVAEKLIKKLNHEKKHPG